MKTATLVCLLLASACVAHADPTCPLNQLDCNGGVTSSQDSHASVFCRDPLGQLGQASSSYDLASGLLTSSSTARGEQGAASGANVFDDFRVVGPSGECPDGIQAHLHVHARFDRAGALAQGDLGADIQDMTAGMPPNHLFLFTRVTTVTDTVLSWPIHHCVGDVFQMHYDLHTGVSLGDYAATAELSFSGVPPGVMIVSCQGYSTEGPIPTLPVSWGSVKARYH